MPVTDEALDRYAATAESALDRTVELLNAARINEAREWILHVAPLYPDSAELQHYARTLPPGRVWVDPTATLDPEVVRREQLWLREHAHEHPRCWVALLGDEPVAIDPDVGAVLDAMKQRPDGMKARIIRLPPFDPWY